MIEELSQSIQLQVPSQPKDYPSRAHLDAIPQRHPQQGLNQPSQQRNHQKVNNKTPQTHPASQIPQKSRNPIQDISLPDDTSPITSIKKVKLKKLMGKLNKSLEDFFLKDGPEETSYVDDISMIKHYNQ